MEYNKKLCPNCKTGAESYLLDNKSPMCPYLGMHTGKACAKYIPMQKCGFDKVN